MNNNHSIIKAPPDINRPLSLPLVGEGGPLAVDEVLMGMAQDFANHAPEESIRQTLR